ncbi:MAG: hypothetical protein LBG16_05630, partial [Elusimicrobiota bacterium]|nr:hypothetical protein [Elusimicrobiota bacterium]
MKKNIRQDLKFLFNLAAGLTLALGFAAFTPQNAAAQTAMVTNNFVAYPDATKPSPTPDLSSAYQCQIDPKYYPNDGTDDYKAAGGMPFSGTKHDRSFYNGADVSPSNSSEDQWVKAALIEFDQPTANNNPTTGTNKYRYPNHCLTICGEVTCSNPVRQVQPPEGSSAGTMYQGSGSFPIQTVLFEIFKYQKNANPYNPDSAPPIRTIALYPAQEKIDNAMCRGVGAYKIMLNGEFKGGGSCCECCKDDGTVDLDGDCGNKKRGAVDFLVPDGISDAGTACKDTCTKFNPTNVQFDKEACINGETRLRFCAPWDGAYEIDGEFGKSNGQFGYRTTISSKWPGDGVSTSDVDIQHTIVYPGNQQIPIQVDVTNV